jgi:hypothetical protein
MEGQIGSLLNDLKSELELSVPRGITVSTMARIANNSVQFQF